LDSRVETASSGISALWGVRHVGEAWVSWYAREALDESELVDNLAALVGDVLLCCLELLLGGVLLEGDLGLLVPTTAAVWRSRTHVELGHVWRRV
jgi:hypothetical protein